MSTREGLRSGGMWVLRPLFHPLVLAIVDLFELFMSRRAGVGPWATHGLIAVNCVHAARKSNKIQIKNVNLRKKNKTRERQLRRDI